MQTRYDINILINKKLAFIKETKIIDFLIKNFDKKYTYSSEQELMDKISSYSKDFKEKHTVFNYLLINRDNKFLRPIIEKNIENLSILPTTQNQLIENNSIILFNPNDIIITEALPPEISFAGNHETQQLVDINYYIEIEKCPVEQKTGEIIIYDFHEQ